jgi:hypothetical protein
VSDSINVLAARRVPELLKLATLQPPTWTRMEPVSLSGDPKPGLAAAVLDPLWLLGRQWQFGEFQAEDAGTPLSVEVTATAQPLTAWAAGPAPAAGTVDAGRSLTLNHPLEPAVEAESTPSAGVGWRWRAEAAQALLAALAEVGADLRATLVGRFPLPVSSPPPENAGAQASTPPTPRLWRTIARGTPDAEAVAQSLEAAAGAPPDWLPADAAAVQAAAQDWLAWYRSQVSPPTASTDDAWVDDRLEYRFMVRAGAPSQQQVFVAPLHDGATVDWSSFDAAPALRISVPGEDELAPDAATRRVQLSMLASPVRFPGMPSDRLFQFEDGNVNLGRLEVQRHDLARLCFTEFAMVYGNDWFAVPLDVPAGSWVNLQTLTYTTTFGERVAVAPADDRSRSGRFRMFECTVAGTDQSANGLLVPPTARGTLEGAPLEDVLFLRDEAANMAWAVEQTVQASSGDPRNRSDEERHSEAASARLPGTELKYLFASAVPEHWIPLVPVARGGVGPRGGFQLRKGTMGTADASRGVLLRPTPFDLQDEEVVREGVRVRRLPALARGPMGERLRWVARRVSVGRGEGNSQLRFDEAAP